MPLELFRAGGCLRKSVGVCELHSRQRNLGLFSRAINDRGVPPPVAGDGVGCALDSDKPTIRCEHRHAARPARPRLATPRRLWSGRRSGFAHLDALPQEFKRELGFLSGAGHLLRDAPSRVRLLPWQLNVDSPDTGPNELDAATAATTNLLSGNSSHAKTVAQTGRGLMVSFNGLDERTIRLY